MITHEPEMDGTRVRELKSANDNPWYCLATLRGEQPVGRFDRDLAEKNRLAFQQWFGDVPEGQRSQLAKDFANRVGNRSMMPPERSAQPDFSHTHFDRPLVLVSFVFYRSPTFSSSSFHAHVDFSEAQFHGPTDFSSATFSADVTFRSAMFAVSVDFSAVSFSGKINCQNANITCPKFDGATFSDSAQFHSATIHGPASFLAAKFLRAANFGSVNFTGVANFGAVSFFEHAGFRKSKFSDIADFSGATFSNSVHFINGNFDGDTIFRNVSFTGQAPDFRGATMHEATEWPGVTWPRPPKKKAEAQQQVYAYERLKQEMERLKKHDDEQAFFRKELRARRGLFPVLSGQWLLNFSYHATSDYGNSLVRPLLSLACIVVIAAAILMRTPAPPTCTTNLSADIAFKISLANAFVFLPDKREIMTPEVLSCWSNTARLVSAVQSLTSVVLLFLLGLAIRNRFRMK
ncbi:hypothetical protein A1D31_20155 [Bradyrhizobium liaoningense]|nr:hypothetical protein A1D31_20155 [Bradyrhizobium liaoningense]